MPSVRTFMRWACVFLLACSPSATPVVAVGPMTATRTQTVAAGTMEGATVTTGDACVLDTGTFQVEPSTALCAFGACFAQLDESIDAKSRIRIPIGAATAIALELETGALRLRGTIRGASLLVAPTTAKAIDGWIVPIALGSVQVRSGSASGDVEIEVKDSPELELALPVRASRRCYEIGFADPDDADDALDALAGDGKRANNMSRTDAGARLPVSRTPTGPPVAFYRTAEETEVEIVDVERGMSRIIVRTSRIAFTGWVPSSMLKGPLQIGLGGVGGSGYGRGGRAASGTSCKHEVPLFARVGGNLVRVGEVLADETFDVTMKDEHVVIDGRASGFHLADGVRFEITPADLRACSE